MLRLRSLSLRVVQRHTAASSSASPANTGQHSLTAGSPSPMWTNPPRRSTQAPNFKVSIGQVAFAGGENGGGYSFPPLLGGFRIGGRGRVTGGFRIGGSVTGGRVTGGFTIGGSVPGGRVTGGFRIGGSVTGGRVTGGFTIGGSVPGGRVTGGFRIGGSVTGGRVTGGFTIGGSVPGGRVIGGFTIGGSVTGGLTIGGRVTGGKVIGGLTMGGRVIGPLPFLGGFEIGLCFGGGLPQKPQPRMGVAEAMKSMEMKRNA
ncbi:Transmembrane protein [Quillaja saponaria]|uniref:Transmembrane protein n=1 Tax=Quillaja saponaria TaxID=32244 RepID=A0AAD7PIE5_QUISA|nr:Transmembrane protein [Quillaja saponaria]